LSIQAANPNQLDQDFYVGESSSIRDDVNTLGKMIAKLRALESYEQAPDKDVVERANSQLAKVASTTEEFIKYLKDNPGRFANPHFREMTTNLWEQSGALWSMLHDSVKLGDLKQRETHIQQDLAKVTQQNP
jgi:hypothetical protein